MNVVSGCGGGSTGGTPLKKQLAAGGPTTDLPEGDLADKVIKIADLPVGWSVLPEDGDDNPDDDCDRQLEQIDETPTAELEVSFQNRNSGAFLFEYISAYDTRAGEAFDSAAAAIRSCSGTSVELGGQRYRATIGELSFPAVGDESTAFEVSFDGAARTVGYYYVLLRSGSYVFVIGYLSTQGTPPAAAVKSYAELAVAKARE